MILYGIFCALLLAVLAVLLAPLIMNGHLPKQQRWWVIAGVSTVFLTLAFGLYYWLGAAAIVPLLAEREVKLAGVEDNIIKNSAEVTVHPKNLGAWVELGQDFMETDRFSAAANAFKQSVALSRGNPLLIMAYAQAMIYAADGKVTDEAKKSLDMVVMQQPQNPEALYYLAVKQLQDGHNEEAMKEMKDLYHSLPDGSPVKAMIDHQIGKN